MHLLVIPQNITIHGIINIKYKRKQISLQNYLPSKKYSAAYNNNLNSLSFSLYLRLTVLGIIKTFGSREPTILVSVLPCLSIPSTSPSWLVQVDSAHTSTRQFCMNRQITLCGRLESILRQLPSKTGFFAQSMRRLLGEYQFENHVEQNVITRSRNTFIPEAFNSNKVITKTRPSHLLNIQRCRQQRIYFLLPL